MTKLINQIVIDASIERIWTILATVGELQNYDPTVRTSTVISEASTDIGAARRVVMRDGKHWFSERITVCKPNEALTYQLTGCNFPIEGLRHSYSFERIGRQIKVTQVMEYETRFGFFGRLMDVLILRTQSDVGVKRFLNGLKEYAERSSVSA
jgi:ribosome-associated toxin RatA of RatAB toxin-antitoxin module